MEIKTKANVGQRVYYDKKIYTIISIEINIKKQCVITRYLLESLNGTITWRNENEIFVSKDEYINCIKQLKDL